MSDAIKIIAFATLFIALFLVSCSSGDYVRRDNISVKVRDAQGNVITPEFQGPLPP